MLTQQTATHLRTLRLDGMARASHTSTGKAVSFCAGQADPGLGWLKT